MRDFVDFIQMVIAPMIVLLLVAIGIVVGIGTWDCSKYQETTGKATKFRGMSCYIKDGASWYAWEEYKYRLATKGEMK